MDVLYTALLADLNMVLVCCVILLLALAFNVVLSLYHNINTVGETFDVERLWQGVKKVLVLVVGTMLMAVAADTATTLPTQYVPDINNQVHDLITVAMIAVMIGIAAWRHTKDVYSTFISILNDKPSEVVAAVDVKEQYMDRIIDTLITILVPTFAFLIQDVIKGKKRRKQFTEQIDQAQNKELQKLWDGVETILRDRIIQKCEYHIQIGKVSAVDIQESGYMNEPYETLGGNGTIKTILSEVHKLKKQIESEDEEQWKSQKCQHP